MSTSRCGNRVPGADWGRPTTNAPKPNTRFLKNIIKETDSHNAALRAKEVHDAKSRLRRLYAERLENPKTTKRSKDLEDQNSKRRRLDPEQGLLPRRSSRRVSMKLDDYKEDRISRRHQNTYHHSDEEKDGRTQRHRHKHHHHRHRSQSRKRSKDGDLPEHRGSGSNRERRTRASKEDRVHSHKRRRRRDSSTSSSTLEAKTVQNSGESGNREDNRSTRRKDINEGLVRTEQSEPSDSDPLESIVGPLPPPSPPKIRARGRGKFASSSAMDSHFSSKYDPSQDICPNSGSENDWDQALEALRDRQRWKQQGAERLRSAGFTEEEVGKWEKGGGRREEDVKWNGKGEGREWDRGKVMGKDGIETRPEWGRLQGT